MIWITVRASEGRSVLILSKSFCKLLRIRVENAIRRIKIFRIAKEKYRNDRRKYDHIIHDVVCGVVNQTTLRKRAGGL